MNTKIMFALALLMSSSAFAASGLGDGMRRSQTHATLGLTNKKGESLFREVAKTSSITEQLNSLQSLIVIALVAKNDKQRNFLFTQLEEICKAHKIDFAAQVAKIQKDAAVFAGDPAELNEDTPQVGSFEFDFEM